MVPAIFNTRVPKLVPVPKRVPAKFIDGIKIKAKARFADAPWSKGSKACGANPKATCPTLAAVNLKVGPDDDYDPFGDSNSPPKKARPIMTVDREHHEDDGCDAENQHEYDGDQHEDDHQHEDDVQSVDDEFGPISDLEISDDEFNVTDDMVAVTDPYGFDVDHNDDAF